MSPEAQQAQSQAHAELLKLYEVTIADVDRTKRWQWNVLHTIIVGQGAVLTLFFQDAARGNIALRVIAVALVATLGFVGVKELLESDETLDKFRERLGRCYDAFSGDFNTAFGMHAETRRVIDNASSGDRRERIKPKPWMVRTLVLITASVVFALCFA